MAVNIQKNVSLKQFTTFKIGGPAKYFCQVKSIDELREAINWSNQQREKLFNLGGGSNVLFSDAGFAGIVIQIANEGVLLPEGHASKEKIITTQAGTRLSQLVGFALENNLAGLQWAAGIPGTVGGAIRGNAGAFGAEMKDNVVEITAINIESGEEKKFNNGQCQFDYRSSIFKTEPKWIIWEAKILLTETEDAGVLRENVNQIIAKRRQNQPNMAQFPSAGSVFKNPNVSEKVVALFEQDKEIKCKDNKVPAGWLIERCDLKGKRIGGAMVSPKQANFIVNTGQASASDVLMLVSLVKQKVRNQFGVQLQEELEIVL